MTTSSDHLLWPFLEPRHADLAAELEPWAAGVAPEIEHARERVDDTCRDLVRRLGAAGWLKRTVALPDHAAWPDVRALCVARETLARHDGLLDFAFAMQGLGAGPVSLAGT
jgi:acyl-CoA dehydrogenase